MEGRRWKKGARRTLFSQMSDFYMLKMCYPQMDTKSIYMVPKNMNFSEDLLNKKFQA